MHEKVYCISILYLLSFSYLMHSTPTCNASGICMANVNTFLRLYNIFYLLMRTSLAIEFSSSTGLRRTRR